MDIQTCPRRMQEFGGWERKEGLDSWMETPRREDELVPFCSFCGSLHPGKFMELASKGWTITPTDKDYKAYIGNDWKPVSTSEDLATLTVQPTSNMRSKFYYQHLTETQKMSFVQMYNERKIELTEPGYFYVLPFFMTRV